MTTCRHQQSVFTIAAIAAAEFRSVLTMDIGGAFLNASMKNSKSGVVVHMRLDKLMSTLLIQLDPTYQKFLQRDGTLIVELDKALYGCVEAAKLWYEELSCWVGDFVRTNTMCACSIAW